MKLYKTIRIWLLIAGLGLSLANVTQANPPSSGLKAWFRSDHGVLTDSFGGVTNWLDISGNGNHAVQTTYVLEPNTNSAVIGYAAKPVLDVGAGQHMTFDLPNANLYAGMTVIFVGSPGSSQSDWETVVSSDGVSSDPRFTGGIRWAFGLGSDSTFAQGLGWAGTGANVNLGNGNILSANAFFLNVYRTDKTAWDVYVSRDDVATKFSDDLTGAGTISDTSFPTGSFRGVLGTENTDGGSPATYALNGYIAEVLIYDHSLSGSEFTDVVNYLNAQYIPEPSTVLLLGIGGLLFWRRRMQRK